MPPVRQLVPQTKFSNQAETSSENPMASGIRMRTLIELQVISAILSDMAEPPIDVRDLRASIAADQLGES